MSKYTVIAIIGCGYSQTTSLGHSGKFETGGYVGFLAGFLFEDCQKNIYKELDISQIKQQLIHSPECIEGLKYNLETKVLEYPNWLPIVSISNDDYYLKYEDRILEINKLLNLIQGSTYSIKEYIIDSYSYKYESKYEGYKTLSMFSLSRLNSNNVFVKEGETILPAPFNSNKDFELKSLFESFSGITIPDGVKFNFDEWDFTNIKTFESMFKDYTCVGESSINFSNKVLGLSDNENCFSTMFLSTKVHTVNLSNTQFRAKEDYTKNFYSQFFLNCQIKVLDLRGSNLLHELNKYIENEFYCDAKSMIENVFKDAVVQTLLLDDEQKKLSFVPELLSFLNHHYTIYASGYSHKFKLEEVPSDMDWNV